MFTYLKRWRTTSSSRTRTRSVDRLQFRGHIEKLESRTVLSASFGSPQLNLPTPGSPEFSSGYSSHEVVSRELANTAANASRLSVPSDAHDGQRNQFERLDTAGTSASTVVTLYVVSSPVPAAPRQAADGLPMTALPLDLETLAASSAQRDPVVVANATHAAAAETSFVTSPLVGLSSLEATSTSFENVADTTIVNSQENAQNDPAVTNEILDLMRSSEAATFDSLESDRLRSFASDKGETEELSFRLFDDLSNPLDALKREQDAIDEVLSGLFDVPEWRNKSPRKTAGEDRTSTGIEVSHAAEIAEVTNKDRKEADIRQSYAEGGMVLLQAEGDPNLDARDLVAVITGNREDEFEWQSGVELSVGTYLRFETGSRLWDTTFALKNCGMNRLKVVEGGSDVTWAEDQIFTGHPSAR